MSEENIIEKTVYSKEYDDSENLFVKQNSELTDWDNVGFVHSPLRQTVRDHIVKRSIEYSEKYHISLAIKEDEHFLFVAFSFGKYIYFDTLKPMLCTCDDVFVAHDSERTIVELIFCTDDMTLEETDEASDNE